MRLRWIPLTLSLLTASTVLMGQTAPAPPVAKQVEHIAVWHGEKVNDPYYWLREKSEEQSGCHQIPGRRERLHRSHDQRPQAFR